MRTTWLALLLLGLQSLYAQVPAYLHYTVRDGLPGNLVYCGLQDHRGLLWFGTDKGLACFDGLRFRVYGVAEGLPDPDVLNMYEDRQGRLWLFCFRKKPCYIHDGEIITELQDTTLAQLKLETGIYLLFEDHKDRIWFTGHTNRICRIEAGKTTVFQMPSTVFGLWQVGDTILVLGSDCIMRWVEGAEPEVVYKIKQDVIHYPYVGATATGDRVLFAYTNRILLFEWKNGRINAIDSISGVRGMVSLDKSQRFWFCTPSSGAICFDNQDRSLANPVPYLPGKKVTTQFEDGQGTIWFNTYDEGVYALPQKAPTQFFTDLDPSSKNIRSLARSDDGSILAGNGVGEVLLVKDGRLRQKFSLDTPGRYNLVRQIIPVSSNAFWAATDAGLHYYNLATHQKKQFFNIFSVKGILQTSDTIWLASHGRLSTISAVDFTEKNWINHRTTAVEQDDAKNIWAGSLNGFYSKKDSFQTNWGDTFPQLKSRIISIKNAGGNQLWIATAEKGLILADIDAGKVIRVDEANNHLPHPIFNIQSLFVAPNNDVWMATNQGIYHLDRRWHLERVSAYDGLADDDVNALLLHQDTLWAATVSGLTCLDLKSASLEDNFASLLVNLRYQVQNHVTQLHLLDSFHITERQLVLPPNAGNLELDLAGLDFRSRGNLQFEITQTRMLPPFPWWTFDNLLSWVSSGFKGKNDTLLVQDGTLKMGAYLPPGKYRIQVDAMKASGVRSQKSDTWTIIRRPYWYETIWLFLLLWAGLILGVRQIYRARLAYQEIDAAASALQLQALQSQMNPHFIGNTVNAIQQFLHPPDPEKTSEYIALFTRLLRRTMHYSEEPFIPFEEELAYVREYLQLVQLRFEHKFHYVIRGMDQIPPGAQVPSMLLQPVLENATMHGMAPEGVSTLELEFSRQGDQLRFMLTDNGIGVHESKRQKQITGETRISKGLEILEKKIQTLNRLHRLDLCIQVQDLADLDPTRHGTRVTITYFPDKTWKIKTKNPATISPLAE